VGYGKRLGESSMKVGDMVIYSDVLNQNRTNWGYGLITETYLEERTVEVFWPLRGTSRTTHPEFLEVVSDS
tara:strand:- start:501 stop:713 length:213 start_codon:yes stop_codon:yes gene_type:complete